MVLACFVAAILVCFLVFCAFSNASRTVQKAQTNNPVRKLEQTTGFIRTVGQSEFNFYQQIAERNTVSASLSSQMDDNKLQKTKDYINRVNAAFYIANQLGLCEPYSFASFQREMEKENNLREVKKERGEVFYGPEQFNLVSYYDYQSSNLKLKVVDQIVRLADAGMADEAKQYFEKNKSKYDTIQEIRYEQNENGTVTEQNLKQSDFLTLKTTDGELFDFLIGGKPGETKEYSLNGQTRSVTIRSKDMEQATFENVQGDVMRDYVTLVYYDRLVSLVAKNNPVQFGEGIK